MYSDFILLESDSQNPKKAERLALGETAGRNEAWLRDTLFANPGLLPLADIDPSFGTLIPLCRELRTPAGPVDVAFINQYGQLILVECKLWRNPEARRKVVGQILNYAGEISQWTYADLQRQVSVALGRKGNIPFELAKAQFPAIEERLFIDAATTALRRGRFLLIIAGDGIRKDIEAMADLINRNAATGFSLGLVEVALYGFEDGTLVAQPRVIAKTQIITRTVIVVRDSTGSVTSCTESSDAEPLNLASDLSSVANDLGESPKQAAYRAWWTPVLNISFDDPDQDLPKLYYPNNVRTPLPFPNTWITAYRFGNSMGVATGGKSGGDQAFIACLVDQEKEILSRLPVGTVFRKSTLSNSDCFVIQRSSTEFTSDEDRTKWFIEVLNAFVNVFRPIAKRLADELHE